MKAPWLILLLIFSLLSIAVFSQSLHTKLSPGLSALLKTKKPGDEIKILLSVKNLSALQERTDVTIINAYKNAVLIKTSAAQLASLLADDNIEFASNWRQPKEELTTGAFDLSLNKINLVHNNYASLNGAGILVSIKEQRLDTSDIDWKGRYVNSGVAAPTESIHASIMATIIGGGANSSPFAKGVAWGSNLTSSDFATLLPDANQVYVGKNIFLQNHSYGTAIENFYGADAAAYDASVYSIPTLVHVFSAGNSGTSSSTAGSYSGLQNFANLTGSFKMAKNIITVGHVDSANNVLPLSSRGPAYDGRVKPELVAFGEDGSSGAAALVSGTVALLQQGYKASHNNQYPSAALVKAILLNSADDIGTEGIDYASGYGSLNAYNAAQTLTGNHFFEDIISNNQTKNFSIPIPANAKQLKVTIAWTDTAAAANAPKALVNDIDAVVNFSSTLQSWQPWVLSTKANTDSLLRPAVRATDTLNNAEQISIDNPQAGSYQLQIRGTKIQTASQSFAVAYQVDTLTSFVWTYPTASDIIKAGAKNYLRWQTTISGNAAIDYSKDGTSWQSITASADLNKHYFIWNAPDTLTTALLRMRMASSNFVSDSFAISPALQMNTGFNCNDSFLLYWNKLPVTQYQVYQLGTQYLQPVLATTDTFRIFQKVQSTSLFYAVAPTVGNKTGQRSFTINYTSQGVGCYVVSFFSVLQNNNEALLSLNLGTLYNVAEISFQKLVGTSFQTIQRFSPNTVSIGFTDKNLSEGINRYRAEIKLANGSTLYSDEDQVFYFPNQPVIVYPNPSAQYNPIHIIVRDQGVYSINIYDASGRLVKAFDLNDILTNIPPFVLSKGVYFVRVITNNSSLFTQKLMVY